MKRVPLEIKDMNFLSPLQQPYNYFPNLPPPSSYSMNLESKGFNLNNKVSPSLLLIIIILSIIFFISGLSHLLVRFLWRPRTRNSEELETVTALQGQLQQLFNLHDSGVDQSFIDTLPVFNYKSIIGLKDPFDCAVCLCEFEGEDKLRLLPKCSHAFHMDCIETWLLSHSTCPLCRDSLVPDFPPSRNGSPLVFVLESRSSEISREIETDIDCNHGNSNNEVDSRMPFSSFLEKSCEIEHKDDEIQPPPPPPPPEVKKVVPVKLGKYRNVDSVGEGGSSTNSIDSRRCFSMGSFAYVMDENAVLQVPIKPSLKKKSIKKHNLPLTPLHRAAMSECSFGSRREFDADIKGSIKGIKRESFSVSKTWVRGKIDRPNSAKVEPERRTVSFRLPLQENKGRGNGERRAVSEIGFDRWEINNGGDDEIHSCNSLDSQVAQTPSFARRTLIWLMGKPSKLVHSDSSSNV